MSVVSGGDRGLRPRLLRGPGVQRVSPAGRPRWLLLCFDRNGAVAELVDGWCWAVRFNIPVKRTS